jgi:hypothetical protein
MQASFYNSPSVILVNTSITSRLLASIQHVLASAKSCFFVKAFANIIPVYPNDFLEIVPRWDAFSRSSLR